MTDRTAVLGLFLLAVLAWSLPPVLRWTSQALRPATPVVYREPGSQQLSWSPRDAVEGTRGNTDMGGCEGLLLGIPLDLNRAGREDLEALPGVGPKVAAAILGEREATGGFGAVEDLLRVPGIGPKRLEALLPLVRVSEGGEE